MECTDVPSICGLPPELLLQVVGHLSFRDHARWLRADRKHWRCLCSILYLRLLPFGAGIPAAHGDATQVTQKDVVRWAIDRGLVSTLKNVNEVEDLAPFLGAVLASGASGHELTAIHQAALCGHTPVVAYLLEKGADVNARTADGLLPMHLAQTGEVVRLLAEHGGRLDRDGASAGVPALTSSISHGCTPDAVAAFLELGADPQYVARDGTTAAEAAIARGNVAALGMLLDAGVDAKKPLPSGCSLLYKAVWLGGRDHGAQTAQTMATMLLDRGVDPNSGFTSGTTERYQTSTLFLAVMMPSSADLVQLLLERGADQNRPYTEKRDRFYATQKSLRGFDEVYADSLVANLVAAIIHSVRNPQDPDGARIRKLQLLLDYGGNIDAMIRDCTLLQYSLSQDGWRAVRAVEIAPTLVRLGADATGLDAHGNTTLHLLCGPLGGLARRAQLYRGPVASQQYATLHRSFVLLAPLLDALVDAGTDRNARDARGRTPLMLLCKHVPNIPTAELIRGLLHHGGIDVRAADARGWNALHYATGEPPNPFHDEPCLRLQVLLSRGGFDAADVNAYSATGRTPLHHVLEAQDRSRDDRRPAAKRRVLTKMRALAMLVRAGADVRARRAGDAPLHLALWQNDELEVRLATRLLLRHGAAADADHVSPSRGLTPLMTVAWAAAEGGRRGLSRNTTEDLVRLLLAAGADAQMRDARGSTAWDMFVDRRGFYPSIWPWTLCFEGVVPKEDEVV